MTNAKTLKNSVKRPHELKSLEAPLYQLGRIQTFQRKIIDDLHVHNDQYKRHSEYFIASHGREKVLFSS